jgi:hypothetical protein
MKREKKWEEKVVLDGAAYSFSLSPIFSTVVLLLFSISQHKIYKKGTEKFFLSPSKSLLKKKV